MKRAINIIFILFLAYTAKAQVETRYYPSGSTIPNLEKILPTTSTIIKSMPSFDVDSLLREDRITEGDCNRPFRFGKGFDVNYTLQDGSWTNVDGGRIWTLGIESPNAFSLNFIFSNFHLPQGAELHIVNDDKTVLYGPVISSAIPTGASSFLTDIIDGDKAYICLFEPSESFGESTLTIKRVVHGYKNVTAYYDNFRDPSSSCNVDVVCHFPEYVKEHKAIGLVLSRIGTSLCSGSLIMATDLLLKPYFLTAYHCVDEDEDGNLSDTEISYTQLWAFKFLYRNISCDVPSVSSGITYNGATLRSAWEDTDFALLEINQDLSQNDQLSWLGWDRSGNTPTSGACLHHPLGDLMKISIEENSFTSTGWSGSYYNKYWGVGFDEGITQSGSSGAPILDQNKRIVGQLYGIPYPEPSDPCDATNAKFGKFSSSWTGGGTNSTRLSNWLDPNNTGVTVLRSNFDAVILGQDNLYSSNVYTTTAIPSIYDVTWTLTGTNASCYTVQNNTPSTNQCTITKLDGVDFVNANNLVLHAYIKNGYTTLNEITKPLTAVYVDGPTILCGSNIYQVKNLPSGCTVSWSWSGTGVTIDNTPIFVEPYYSTNNYFRLSRNSQAYANGTITANILQNNDTIATITKVIDTAIGFSGTWHQGTATATTLQCGQAYPISYGSQVVLQSSDFVGKTVTCTTNGLRLLGGLSHSGNTISFTPMTPLLNPDNIESIDNPSLPKSITIKVANSSSCELYQFTFHVPLTPIMNNLRLNVSASGSEYTFSLEPDSDDANGASEKSGQTWTLEIVRSDTGQTVYSSQDNKPQTVNISGWKAGIYIAVARCGEDTYTQKLVVGE